MQPTSNIRQKVWNFFEKPKSLPAFLVQGVIILFILLSGLEFVIEIFAPEFFVSANQFFIYLETIIVAAFTLEYLLRLWAARSRSKFVIDFYSIIDLLAILPFFLIGLNLSFLRSIKILRLLRMARLLRFAKIMKYSGKLSMTHILQENVVKNIIVIILIVYFYTPIQEFISKIDSGVYGDIMLATSILAVAAMFGAFSFSYESINPYKTADRMFGHITSGLLLLPIGIMFMFLQVILTLEIGSRPTILITAIWLVYLSIILWDFWNVKRIEDRLNEKSSETQA